MFGEKNLGPEGPCSWFAILLSMLPVYVYEVMKYCVKKFYADPDGEVAVEVMFMTVLKQDG